RPQHLLPGRRPSGGDAGHRLRQVRRDRLRAVRVLHHGRGSRRAGTRQRRLRGPQCWSAAGGRRGVRRGAGAATVPRGRRPRGIRTVRVVVTGLVATYPVGGVAWDYLQYVQGFDAIGCDVVYLEDTGQWFYDPAARTFTPDARPGAAYLATALQQLLPGRDHRWA